jgi:hypothetical protein
MAVINTAIIGTTYGYPAAATGFRKLRCAAELDLGTGIRTSSSEEFTTSGFRSCIAVITAAWLREMPL